MPYVRLELPPGVVRPGTKYDARGRWYDSNLVRWHDGAMQPVGGWEQLESQAAVPAGDPIRGMIAWRDNNQVPRILFGNATDLFVYKEDVVSVFALSGFTVGNVDATLTNSLYGDGDYGLGPYGTGDPGHETLVEANTWQFDTFGEDAVAVAYSDGQIWYYDTSLSSISVIAEAPTGCVGVVVTPERFIVALGAGGDMRTVQWPDQGSSTVWTPEANNQAGSLPITGSGVLMAGRRARNETLIWSDTDLFALRYIGGVFVYSLVQIGSACGAASRRSMAVVDGKAFWMGHRAFYVYDGFVRPVACDVGDYVFSDMNRTQSSKIWADVRSEFSEVTWYYPSSGSVEIDRYVTYNYVTGIWYPGQIVRTAGVDRGPFPYPVMSDGIGDLLKHEVGTSYLDADGNEITPYAESGPIEIGSGDRVMSVLGIIPDEKTLGDVQLSVYAAMYPTAEETEHGPFSMANPTSVRLTGRQVRLRAEQVTPGWRLGTPRLEVLPGGRR